MNAHVSFSKRSTSGVPGSTTMIILVPVSVWKQCRSKVSAFSSSMPVQPSTGDNCVAIACSECLHSSRWYCVPNKMIWLQHMEDLHSN